MPIHFKKSSQFEVIRFEIEQHLYDSVYDIEKSEEFALRSVDQFAKAVEGLIDTLEGMYQTANLEDACGEKSFPIKDGRYRVFYKISLMPNNNFEITLLDIDDNKQSNPNRFPSHLTTFEGEQNVTNYKATYLEDGTYWFSCCEPTSSYFKEWH